MTSLDRTAAGTASPGRAYVWATVVITLATLATVLVLAFAGHEKAAVAVATAGLLGGAFQITVHIRR
ncbi:hypothetical protein [Streptomyces violarus]|uniref:hypothetical protein n=1 Tax=Streptomyces violarus TaxID=67380 RepID=UPI0021C051B3|nr:hypothetical protein [Streptomyces violarus]MCT9144051.1 hypothetical protein [Streptomyces violarus]